MNLTLQENLASQSFAGCGREAGKSDRLSCSVRLPFRWQEKDRNADGK